MIQRQLFNQEGQRAQAGPGPSKTLAVYRLPAAFARGQEARTRDGGKFWRVIRMVPRGRVELPTPAFSGPRSTGELPRHRNNEDFTENPASRKTKSGSDEHTILAIDDEGSRVRSISASSKTHPDYCPLLCDASPINRSAISPAPSLL